LQVEKKPHDGCTQVSVYSWTVSTDVNKKHFRKNMYIDNKIIPKMFLKENLMSLKNSFYEFTFFLVHFF
jgi:hypothetical protein